MAPKRAAGFLIYRLISNEIQYLLMKASYGNFHWTPPKGHVDADESDYETALRETHEEAGYTEDDLIIYKNLYKILNYQVNGKSKVVIYWLAQLRDATKNPLLSDEHTEFKFLNKTDAILLCGYKDFANMVEELDVEIKKIHGFNQ
ncbi:bis(5'-nucleosyl)-tetraphosphatase [asymmetrical] [Chironomus tepperi]|uniref:bis(5'-nucleosyl)-tetraphosphatase [asymmetrical] n=1 Tax=Chironomus tepperi TaxID=113505 RepID=UPI00391F7F8E